MSQLGYPTILLIAIQCNAACCRELDQLCIKITPYVVDFCYLMLKLIIELDGGIHIVQQTEDKTRQTEMESLGYCFLRFSNEQVFQHINEVLATIRTAIAESS